MMTAYRNLARCTWQWPKDRLLVTCWCEREVFFLPPADIGETTESCGRPGCHAPAA